MKLCSPAFVGILIQFVCISPSQAQSSPDSVLYNESVSGIHQVYLNEIGDNAQIYHGSEYIRNGLKANGFPFFESDSLLTGSISYQGFLYMNQNLYYNLVSDELIIKNYLHNAFITLSPEKVDSFTIGTHAFLQIKSNAANRLITGGYYEQLSSGDPAVYARREKRLASGTGSEEAKYIQYNYYFIKLKNVFYAVEGKKSLLDILKDQEDVLKKYIRTNKLNFKKNLESSLVLTVNYYSQLKH
jgi:hypothetical protein